MIKLNLKKLNTSKNNQCYKKQFLYADVPVCFSAVDIYICAVMSINVFL